MDFECLRKKWSNIPGSKDRYNSESLLKLRNVQLFNTWSAELLLDTTGSNFSVRGWYHELYKPLLQDKRVLDVGSGLGIDALTFATHGADVTCIDISLSNLEVIKRLTLETRIRAWINYPVKTLYLKSIKSIDELGEYDFIWAQGSLINLPYRETRQEIQALLQHLKVGGRWVELAYPKRRWIREGLIPYRWWGWRTDGKGTPWVEWWDLKKLLRAMSPTKMDVLLNFEFHKGDFNWFDLRKC